MTRFEQPRWPLLVVAIVYLGTLAWMPDGGSWVNDNGLKRIQVDSIVKSGFRSSAIEWPGRSLDPAFAFLPLTRGFYVKRNGKLHASYSPVFALLSAPPYMLLGARGLQLLPLLGALAVLPAVRRLAIFAERGADADASEDSPSAAPTIAVLATGLATPLWFYSATFWEHAPAVALCAWSLVACLRFRAAPAMRTGLVVGALLALPIYLRTDAYLLSGLVGVAAIAGARNLRATLWLGVAFASALAPLWLFHLAVFGDPLGPHVGSQLGAISLGPYLQERTTAILNFLVNAHGNPWWSAVAAAPFWLCVVAGSGLSERGFRIGVICAALGGLFATAIVASGHLASPRPMNWLLVSSGLFAACPLAILAFIRRSASAGATGSAANVRATLLAVVLADAILLAIGAPAINSTGVHWGNRFLLPLYPVLTVLACVTAVAWWREAPRGVLRVVGRTAVSALAIGSVLLQLYSIVLLEKRRGFSSELLERVLASNADLVITDSWFLPMDLAATFQQTPIFYARAERRPELLRRARRAGMRTALLIDRLTPDRNRALPPDVTRMRDPATGFSPVSLRAVSLEAPADRPADVVIITIDTLRADHLSLHGYEHETMPNLIALLPDAVVFDDAISPLPLTDPSLASIMTGLHPLHHGVRHTREQLGESFLTLAEVLKSSGYETAAFTSRYGLLGKVGLGQGFDHQDGQVTSVAERDDDAPPNSRRGAERWQRRSWEVTERVLGWLDKPHPAPILLWVHYYDPHAYYDPPSPFREQAHRGTPPSPQGTGPLRAWWGRVVDLPRTIARYDGEILAVDHHLARVIRRLKELGRFDASVFVVTSDHGESFGERGALDHGEWLYHEQVQVPLLIRDANRLPAGRRIGETVRLADLAPTLIELLGLESPEAADFAKRADGESILPLIRGTGGAPRLAFLESEDCAQRPSPSAGLSPLCSPVGRAGKARALYDGRWKLIVTPTAEGSRRELYDLETDPDEENDQSLHEVNRTKSMQEALDAFYEGAETPSRIDPDLAAPLRALGYLD